MIENTGYIFKSGKGGFIVDTGPKEYHSSEIESLEIWNGEDFTPIHKDDVKIPGMTGVRVRFKLAKDLTLREFIEKLCRPRGPFNISSYKWPDGLPEELLNEANKWYTIGIPGALLILRESDVPKGDYEYSEITPLVVAVVNQKTSEEYFAEEDEARRKEYPEMGGLQ
ncbi:hypothetical protein [Paenibacillus macerans]|uniref:hypothetical protein n=1 Tax=Paenibacillus macerans TaxID=44252 RepID=UPI000EE9F299|nr:hypothetical protein [Paenibacillus macerans]GBK66271.1 hypothetical protein PbDSM24746_62750 [Paenibacillus macerans]GBK72553.1 hypothetical protein PbJCM17693_62610 [Paenibacillus macerans]